MKKPTIELWSTSYMVQTVDTDVLVILIGQFFYLQQLYSVIDLWIAFGVGKDYCFYSINHIILNIGERTSKALPMFFTFTGCNTTSSFFRKEKKAWQSWKSYQAVTYASMDIRNKLFQEIQIWSEEFKLLEHFTILIYDKNSAEVCINHARKELFSKKGRSLKNIPPTKDTLLQQATRGCS